MTDEIKKMLEACGCENPQKVAIVVFCEDGTSKTFFGDMTLRDMALAKHEIGLCIIDKFIMTNSERYNISGE